MEIKHLQKKEIEINKNWFEKLGVTPTKEIAMIHLTEELGELAYQVGNEKMKRAPVDIKNVGEEIADTMIILMVLADMYNLDLDKEIIEKIEEIKNKTKWQS